MKDSIMQPGRELLQTIVTIAQQAGAEIMAVYQQGAGINVENKADDSPLTEADRRAHRLISERLSALTPDVPILSEEGELPAFNTRRSWTRYWLVDPLDGTKEFVGRNGEFTVNIALIDDGEPVLGVVHVPVSGVSYAGLVNNSETGAWKSAESGQFSVASALPIHARVLPMTDGWAGLKLKVAGSRRHGVDRLEQLLATLRQHGASVDLINMGSSLKMCLIAEGLVDLYPRLGPTSEWDTAAAHAILRAAGGDIVNAGFQPLRYNERSSIINPDFFALGDCRAFWASLLEPVAGAGGHSPEL
jgi:3'(2'), 5'-bisphosphate nucleotidase